ncbi:MAG: 5'-deoxynucleotidase [Candidatus Fournierella pullistercoris]|uniref:5'-deoxynucleotidase n=1 Tax=Candidatus Allofournierella pullistercoris TaxID=2838597 RepID=A0A948WMW7_9FIRM|nr:5'-deoxynucleotidase [Candidatus Fournierella pullistercoris]
MKTYPFNALVSRMKYIRRWSLMHAARPETLSEHTTETAVLAHTLCMIAQEVTGTPVRPETVAVAALYHDAQEILTGDMPTPVKYKNERLRNAYKALETESALTMLSMLPPALRQPMTGYVTGRILSPAEERLLKAADRLSALIKCMEEVQAGNREFAAAMEQQRQALSDMHCPEVDYFLERMLPCYSQTLDELTRPEQQEDW